MRWPQQHEKSSRNKAGVAAERTTARARPCQPRRTIDINTDRTHHVGAEADQPSQSEGVRDPVCGMLVDPHTTPHRHQFEGRTYYFCSPGCLSKFKAEPGKVFVERHERQKLRSRRARSTPARCIPQIRQVGPGSCPICGMALEPVLATAETGPNPELVDMTRRFWIGTVLALPVVVLEMGFHFTGLGSLRRAIQRRIGFR